MKLKGKNYESDGEATMNLRGKQLWIWEVRNHKSEGWTTIYLRVTKIKSKRVYNLYFWDTQNKFQKPQFNCPLTWFKWSLIVYHESTKIFFPSKSSSNSKKRFPFHKKIFLHENLHVAEIQFSYLQNISQFPAYTKKRFQEYFLQVRLTSQNNQQSKKRVFYVNIYPSFIDFPSSYQTSINIFDSSS